MKKKLIMNQKKILISLFSIFLFCFSTNSVNAKEINLLINNIKDNLFSSRISSGIEFQGFIESKNKYLFDSVEIIKDGHKIYKKDSNWLILKSKTKIKSILNNPDVSIKWLENTKFMEGDINSFITYPGEKRTEIIDYGYNKYKLYFPFSEAKVTDKSYFEVILFDKVVGYIISPINQTEIKNRSLLDLSKTNWIPKLRFAFNTKINGVNYKIILIFSDKFNSAGIQSYIKKINRKKNQIKISYGHLFSHSNEAEEKLEWLNLNQNKYNLIIPSHEELGLSEENLIRINNDNNSLVAINIDSEHIISHKVINQNNTRVALTAITDEYLAKVNNVINTKSKIKLLDFESVLKDKFESLIKSNENDLIIVFSNILYQPEKNLEIRKSLQKLLFLYPQKQVIFFYPKGSKREQFNQEDQSVNLEFSKAKLFIEQPIDQAIHQVKIYVNEKFINKINVTSKIDFNKEKNKIFGKKELNKSFYEHKLERMKKIFDLFNIYEENNQIILPSLKKVRSFIDSNDLDGLEINDTVYTDSLLAKIFGNILLDSFSAEIAVTKNKYGDGKSTVGDIIKTFFDEWFHKENDNLVLLNITGSDLLKLNEINNSIRTFGSDKRFGILSFSGIDFENNKVRNRDLIADESYRIVTSESILDNLLLTGVWDNSTQVYKTKFIVKEFITKYFENLIEKYDSNRKGFSNDYFNEFSNLLEDSSKSLNPLWQLKLEKLQLSYQNNQTVGNEKLSEVKDSRINTPNSFDLGFQSKFVSLFDTETFSLDNSLYSAFNQSFIQQIENGERNSINRKGEDDISFSNDLKLKFISVKFSETEVGILPFINSTYSTEFIPTINPQTSLPNNRRSELSNSAGLILYPKIFDELRFGVSGRYDFSANPPGLFSPGLFANFNSNYNLFQLPIILDGNIRYFLPSETENLSQLATYGEINAKVNLPIINKINLSLNLNSFIFQGNGHLRKEPLGYGFKIYFGLDYSFIYKPIYNSFY